MAASGLLTTERLAIIRTLLSEQGAVRVGDLMRRLGASRETVRRDLAELETLGEIRRVHGGAVPAGQRAALEPPFASRKVSMLAEKKAIAAAAAQLVQDGESLYLDLGTTALEVARQLSGRQLTIITNSVPAALAAVHAPGSIVVLLGGTLRPGDRALSGAETLRGMQHYYVDTAVIGAGGVSAKAGITDYHLEEAAVRQTAVEHAKRTLVVADHKKFGVVGVAAVCALTDVDCIITDRGVEGDTVASIRSLGVAVVIADDSAPADTGADGLG